MPKESFRDRSNDNQKTRKQKTSSVIPVELIDHPYIGYVDAYHTHLAEAIRHVGRANLCCGSAHFGRHCLSNPG